jgi:hypothetical protein
MANAPLSGRDGKSYSLVLISEKQKYFLQRGWTGSKDQGMGRAVICPTGQISLIKYLRPHPEELANGRANARPMTGSASVSKDGRNNWIRGHPSRRAQGRAPQD